MFVQFVTVLAVFASFSGVLAQSNPCDELLELYTAMPQIIAESAMESQCLAGKACLSFGHLILEAGREEVVQLRKMASCHKKKTTMSYTKDEKCESMLDAPKEAVRAVKFIYGSAAVPLADAFEERFTQLLSSLADQYEC